MWNQLLLSGRNASGLGFGTPTVYQVIYICVKYQVARARPRNLTPSRAPQMPNRCLKEMGRGSYRSEKAVLLWSTYSTLGPGIVGASLTREPLAGGSNTR